MATVKQVFNVLQATLPGSGFPQVRVVAGTSFPVASLAFDDTNEEACVFAFRAENYGSGDITVRIEWYADSASSGDVVFSASLAAITPDSDSQDVETKAFATEAVTTDSHLGTTGQRLHEAIITLDQLDSVAGGDQCWLRIARKAADGSDTMLGDAQIVGVSIEYSDT